MSEKIRCFRATSANAQDYLDNGYSLMPQEVAGDDCIVYKEVIVPETCELIKILANVYDDPKWQKMASQGKPFGEWLDTDVFNYLNAIGIRFEEVYEDDGKNKCVKLIRDEECMDSLRHWRMEATLTGGKEDLFRFAPLDISFPNPLYPAKWWYKYAKEEVEDLISKSLIRATFLQE